jgi:hypothetical protein
MALARLLLRPDQQEVENDKDEQVWNQPQDRRASGVAAGCGRPLRKCF